MSAVYLVCPVRNATAEQTEAIRAYVEKLEAEGHEVYWPARDTVQEDEFNGWQVCEQNACAIIAADEIHIWWDRTSQGSVFDLGVAWALRLLGRHQKLVVANEFPVPEGKAFEKVILRWAGESHKDEEGAEHA